MSDLWIKIRADGLPGTGTQRDPFNAIQFDALMRDTTKIPRVPRQINMIPVPAPLISDPFARGWNLWTGCVLNCNGQLLQARGSGSNHVGYYDVIGGPPNITDVAVHNLIVDCNWAEVQQHCAPIGVNERNVALNGIAALGSRSLVEGCTVRNFYGSLAGAKEAGGIVIGGQSAADVTARKNRVELPAGNYNNGINVWSLTGNATQPIDGATLEKNTIVGIHAGMGWALASAINAGGVHNLRAFKNEAIDCAQLFYNDTGDTVNVVVENNTMLRGQIGASFAQTAAMGRKEKLFVINNKFNCQNRITFTTAAVAIQEGAARDILIASNIITHDGTGKAQPDSFQVFYCFNMNGALIVDNISDAPMQQPFVQGTNLWLRGNRKPDGTIIHPLLADNFV